MFIFISGFYFFSTEEMLCFVKILILEYIFPNNLRARSIRIGKYTELKSVFTDHKKKIFLTFFNHYKNPKQKLKFSPSFSKL